MRGHVFCHYGGGGCKSRGRSNIYHSPVIFNRLLHRTLALASHILSSIASLLSGLCSFLLIITFSVNYLYVFMSKRLWYFVCSFLLVMKGKANWEAKFKKKYSRYFIFLSTLKKNLVKPLLEKFIEVIKNIFHLMLVVMFLLTF